MMMRVDVTTLHRELYAESEAAAILRVPASTLHWWLEGGVRGGRQYLPVIRPEPTGSRTVTWAEFIEAGLLRQYRRQLGVKLGELRRFIDLLRQRTGAPYPLAHFLPQVGVDRRLILALQTESQLPGELWLVVATTDQLLWTPAAEAFIQRVDWEHGLPFAWRPHDDLNSPVRCSPVIRFGRPAIKGISTTAIAEHLDAGEDELDVAQQYGLDVDDVRWAQAFELSRRSTPAEPVAA